MPFAIEERGLDLSTLVSRESPDDSLSLPLRFGLGAGLYFEYFRRPHQSPSHFFITFNRQLGENLRARAAKYLEGSKSEAVHEAMRENALLFNLDRQPTTALMGVEMLSEHLADFSRIPDWQACLADMHREILQNGSAYRRIYLQFLVEIQSLIETMPLVGELSEIADDWDAFAIQLQQTISDARGLEQASRMLRRLAFREEHFWGEVLRITG